MSEWVYDAKLDKHVLVSASEQFRREAVATAQATALTHLERQLAAKQAVIDSLIDERNRIAKILETFYFAPLSLSAVQPVLGLCIELNPEIVEQRR